MKCLMDYFLHIHDNPITDIRGQHEEFLEKAERPRSQGWTIQDGVGGHTSPCNWGNFVGSDMFTMFLPGPTIRKHIIFILLSFIFRKSKNPQNFSNGWKWFHCPLMCQICSLKTEPEVPSRGYSWESER